MLKRLPLFLAILLHALPASPAMACPMELPVSTVTVAGHELEVELAFTEAARVCGLSNRQGMPENHGMLFIQKAPKLVGIWMKDTHFPLSVAFIDASGKIINIHHALSPNQTKERCYPTEPAKYILEVNQGWFEARDIKPGDMVEMHLPLVLDVQ